jgi:hypothetical protein
MINNLVLLYRGCSNNYYKDLGEIALFNCYLKNKWSHIIFFERNKDNNIILLNIHSEYENIREYINSYFPEPGKIDFSDYTFLHIAKSNILSRLFDSSTDTDDISFKRLSNVTDNFLSVCTDVVLSIFNGKQNCNSDSVTNILIQLNVAFCIRIGFELKEINELYNSYFRLFAKSKDAFSLKDSLVDDTELLNLCKEEYNAKKHSYYRMIKVLYDVFSDNNEFEEEWINIWFSGITELRNDVLSIASEYETPVIKELINRFYSLLLHELYNIIGIDFKSEAGLVYILQKTFNTLNQIKSGSKQTLNSSLLSECKRIAEEIIGNMKTDVNGTYWITPGFDDKNMFVQKISESLSSGVSGIALFFGAMYDITKDDKYLLIYEQSLNWIVKYCEENGTSDYSFLTGRMGAVYLLIRSEKYYKDRYFKNALEIARDCDKAFSPNNLPCEYFKGASGILISLLHLYDVTGEEWILEKIDMFFKHIVDGINYGVNGAFWDRNGYSIKGLSGFSHGVAGVFFALLELGNYLNNRTILNLAEQAYQYEKNLFDEERINWKDNRIGIFSDDLKDELNSSYFKKDYSLFCNPNYVYGWCHGSPGIALTRLRAFEILNHPDYKKEFDAVINTLINDENITSLESNYFTLCHGIGSLIEDIFEARNIKDNDIWDEKIFEICNLMLEDFSTINNYKYNIEIFDINAIDISLLNGISGIGYFYLRAINSITIDSILLPRVKKTRKENRKGKEYYFDLIDDKELSEILIKKFFRRTYNVLEIFESINLGKFLKEFEFSKDKNILLEFISFVGELIKENSLGVNYLCDIFKLEKSILDLDSNIASYALINKRFELQDSLIKNILTSDIDLLNAKLCHNTDTESVKCMYDWNDTIYSQIYLLQMKPSVKYKVLIARVDGVQEKEVDKFTFDIYNMFAKTKTVKEVVAYFEQQQSKRVIECVVSLLKECFLLIS